MTTDYMAHFDSRGIFSRRDLMASKEEAIAQEEPTVNQTLDAINAAWLARYEVSSDDSLQVRVNAFAIALCYLHHMK